MRFIHTADWHLGRLFHGVHLTEDQAYVLEQFVELVREARPDAVLLAGDIYDRAVPPPEAVTLLDETLTRIAVGLRVPVILMAGNHDSPDRLGFGAQLMTACSVHLFGRLRPDPEPVVLSDEHGPVRIVALPYAEPALVRERLDDASVSDHAGAFRALTDRARHHIPSGQRAVLMAHVFADGGQPSESERPLSIGGASTVDPASFKGFQYVALGHMHRAQSVGAPQVQYSGSLLKYSFSEAAHAKSVALVEMDACGAVHLERLPLTPRRDLRILKGTLEELIEQGRGDDRREDYVMAELTDRGALLDPIGRIREVYPNCLQLDRSNFFAATAPEAGARPVDHRSLSEEELFGDFMKQVSGESPTAEECAAFREIVEAMDRREREA